MGEDELMVNGSLKRSLEISNILIHPEYKPNAPTYSFPSDFDVGKSMKYSLINSSRLNKENRNRDGVLLPDLN